MTDNQPTTRQAPKPMTGELADIFRGVRSKLVAAAASAKHPWHQPVFTTVDLNGRPEARTVVLRSAEGLSLLCHTDARAPKVTHLAENPNSEWLFYDPSERIQLRVQAECTVHTDDELADLRWIASHLSSRRCYLAPRVPGTPSDEPDPNLPENLLKRAPTADESEAGRQNFAVIRARVNQIDWLHLHHAGHRRAVFTRTDGQFSGSWIAV